MRWRRGGRWWRWRAASSLVTPGDLVSGDAAAGGLISRELVGDALLAAAELSAEDAERADGLRRPPGSGEGNVGLELRDGDAEVCESADDLVSGENCFFVATGITDGELLRGVRYRAGGVTTHSLVMRSKSGTIRLIESHHQLAKLRAYSSIDFDHAASAGAEQA